MPFITHFKKTVSSFFFLPFTRHLLQKECSHHPHISHPTAPYHAHGRATASCSSGLGLTGLSSRHLRRPLPIETNLLSGPEPCTDGAPGSVISPAQPCSRPPGVSTLCSTSRAPGVGEPFLWGSKVPRGAWPGEEGLRSSTCSSEGKPSPAVQSEHLGGVGAVTASTTPSPAASLALLVFIAGQNPFLV